MQIQILFNGTSHNVTIDRPDEEKELNEFEMILQYEVDLSLYPFNTTLTFLVSNVLLVLSTNCTDRTFSYHKLRVNKRWV